MQAELPREIIPANHFRSVRRTVTGAHNPVSVYGCEQHGPPFETDILSVFDAVNRAQRFCVPFSQRFHIQMIPGRLDPDLKALPCGNILEICRFSGSKSDLGKNTVFLCCKPVQVVNTAGRAR